MQNEDAPRWWQALALVAATLAVWSIAWNLPAIEDDRFWWIPQGLIEAERGPTLFPTGELPSALLPQGTAPPPQWTGGIPDYAHPPVFFLYLGGWYALFGPGMRVTHLALLPLALLLTLGTWRLARRVAPSDSALGAALLLALTPAVVAQVARADLDLGLLAVTPWALEALLARRRLRFGVLAALAASIKEPGVLLVVPGLVQALGSPRRSRVGAVLAALAPLAALGSWAVAHRARTAWGLAEPERLAPDLLSHLSDVFSVAGFILGAQGRWVLTASILAALVWRGMPARGPVAVLASHTLVHVAFFGTINFLGGDPLRAAGSHLRYLLPALPSLMALGAMGVGALAARAPVRWAVWAVATGLAFLDWHAPPRGGVERNLYALDVARAEGLMASRLREAVASGTPVWVGSYAYVAYTSPAVGFPAQRVAGLKVYGQDTDPTQIPAGAYVLESSHGEPLGRISQQLKLEPVLRVQVYQGWAQLHRVVGPLGDVPPP